MWKRFHLKQHRGSGSSAGTRCQKTGPGSRTPRPLEQAAAPSALSSTHPPNSIPTSPTSVVYCVVDKHTGNFRTKCNILSSLAKGEEYMKAVENSCLVVDYIHRCHEHWPEGRGAAKESYLQSSLDILPAFLKDVDVRYPDAERFQTIHENPLVPKMLDFVTHTHGRNRSFALSAEEVKTLKDAEFSITVREDRDTIRFKLSTNDEAVAQEERERLRTLMPYIRDRIKATFEADFNLDVLDLHSHLAPKGIQNDFYKSSNYAVEYAGQVERKRPASPTTQNLALAAERLSKSDTTRDSDSRKGPYNAFGHGIPSILPESLASRTSQMEQYSTDHTIQASRHRDPAGSNPLSLGTTPSYFSTPQPQLRLIIPPSDRPPPALVYEDVSQNSSSVQQPFHQTLNRDVSPFSGDRPTAPN